MQKFGIIGYPLSYSLSPVIHNRAFALLDVEAEYSPYPFFVNNTVTRPSRQLKACARGMTPLTHVLSHDKFSLSCQVPCFSWYYASLSGC